MAAKAVVLAGAVLPAVAVMLAGVLARTELAYQQSTEPLTSTATAPTRVWDATHGPCETSLPVRCGPLDLSPPLSGSVPNREDEAGVLREKKNGPACGNAAVFLRGQIPGGGRCSE